MNLRFLQPARRCGWRLPEQGFSMTQVMVASVIFLSVVGAVISTNFFGLRIMEVTQSKLGANEYTRRVLGTLTADIQAARLVTVGDGDSDSMTPAGLNRLQQGNAVQLCASTNTNTFIRYYRDPSDNALKRITNGMLVPTVVASYISNANVFTLESFRGVVLSNAQNNFVVGINLQFSEMPNPRSPMGADTYFQSYVVQTKVSRRATD